MASPTSSGAASRSTSTSRSSGAGTSSTSGPCRRRGELAYKLDLEFVEPIPLDALARTLSAGGALFAYPQDDTREGAPSVVYRDGQPAGRAWLVEGENATGEPTFALAPLAEG